MAKIYLVNYTDNTDNTKGTICASQQPIRYATENTMGCIKEWLQAAEDGGNEDDLRTTLGELRGTGNTYYGDYDIYVEETELY